MSLRGPIGRHLRTRAADGGAAAAGGAASQDPPFAFSALGQGLNQAGAGTAGGPASRTVTAVAAVRPILRPVMVVLDGLVAAAAAFIRMIMALLRRIAGALGVQLSVPQDGGGDQPPDSASFHGANATEAARRAALEVGEVGRFASRLMENGVDRAAMQGEGGAAYVRLAMTELGNLMAGLAAQKERAAVDMETALTAVLAVHGGVRAETAALLAGADESLLESLGQMSPEMAQATTQAARLGQIESQLAAASDRFGDHFVSAMGSGHPDQVAVARAMLERFTEGAAREAMIARLAAASAPGAVDGVADAQMGEITPATPIPPVNAAVESAASTAAPAGTSPPPMKHPTGATGGRRTMSAGLALEDEDEGLSPARRGLRLATARRELERR